MTLAAPISAASKGCLHWGTLTPTLSQRERESEEPVASTSVGHHGGAKDVTKREMVLHGMTALLDANVLYPAGLRDFLLRLADQYLYRPLWSATIHEEWIASPLEATVLAGERR